MSSRCLAALHIGNFKAFADTQRVPLKPITLIFGPNSAGKSSFIHSLALAHEAQFGRDKRSLARLDVHHTDIGGSSIDLGGFRQYVHHAQANRRVEWGAELTVANLGGRLAQLLAPVNTITVTLSLGIELDDQDRPKPGAEPRVEAIDISADGAELLRMSRRRSDAHGSLLRLDRLDAAHPVFRQVLKAIVESATTSEEMRPEDFEGANAAIADLLPELQIRVEQFFPTVVELPKAEGAELSPVSLLFPISKGNRREDIAQAVRFYLPRAINDLVKGLSEVLADELKRLQYLGPLRSFPPRHLAFAEYEDANWYAGGGYAWDVVRRDDQVREAVNSWLGSDKLQTPYQLMVRSLVALDQMAAPIEEGLEDLFGRTDESIQFDPDELKELEGMNDDASAYGSFPTQKDLDAQVEWLVGKVETSSTDRIRELVLIDKRTSTVVTHRDVGIGISQVLPVLVMAYGSQGKLIAMEQPEVHLHPALQAELGDVFIEAALGERQNTFILETHSEHLILRLMRRIREGKIHPDDVGVVFVQPLSRGSRFIELRIDEEGDFIDEWPGGFFEESFHEKFAGR
jgi:hypothetical protein